MPGRAKGTQDAVPKAGDQVSAATVFALVVISSIALMVGGIGVMAIMMISVTERTREIGVRKALGARRREILWQFLLEASFLTSFGGILVAVAWQQEQRWTSLALGTSALAATVLVSSYVVRVKDPKYAADAAALIADRRAQAALVQDLGRGRDRVAPEEHLAARGLGHGGEAERRHLHVVVHVDFCGGDVEASADSLQDAPHHLPLVLQRAALADQQAGGEGADHHESEIRGQKSEIRSRRLGAF